MLKLNDHEYYINKDWTVSLNKIRQYFRHLYLNVKLHSENEILSKSTKVNMNKLIFITILLFTSIVSAQDDAVLEFFLNGIQVMDITSDGSSIWFATNGSGIYKYTSKSNEWKQYSSSQGNLQNDLFYCIAANKDYVWAGSADGLFMFDKKNGNWSKRKFGLGGQLANWIRALAYDKYQNVLWIGRFKYFSKYDVRTKKYYDYDLTIGGNDKTNMIKSVQVDGDSLLWVGTEAGLYKYDKSKDLSNNDALTFYDKTNNFSSQGEQISVSSILLDRNYIWLGLDEFITPDRPQFNTGGIFKFDKNNDWMQINDSKGLPGNGIYDLELTGNYIWASIYQFGKSTKETFGRGLALINRVTNKVILIRDERIPRTVYTMYFDGTNMWLGTESGLIKVNFLNKLAQISHGVKK
jgi:ligand-binding sensor domain-containing protein